MYRTEAIREVGESAAVGAGHALSDVPWRGRLAHLRHDQRPRSPRIPTALASLLQSTSQLRRAAETILPKWEIPGDFGRSAPVVFFKTGHGGAFRGTAPAHFLKYRALPGTFGHAQSRPIRISKSPRCKTSRGEDECLYNYRARCAPG